MGKMILNEAYKFFKSKKNLIIIGIFFAYLIGINIHNFNQYDNYFTETATSFTLRQLQADGDLSQINQILKNTEGLTKEQIEELEQEARFHNVERNTLMVISHNYVHYNPETSYRILRAINRRYQNILRGLEEGIITEDYLYEKNLDIHQMEKQLLLNNYILDNEIQPILNPYDMTGANALKQFLSGNNLIIFMFLIALLAIDIYLSEVEEGSYKLSFTQPFKRSQIFIGKVTTIVCLSIALVLIGAILNFTVVSVLNGIGNMSYPMITDESIKKLSTTGTEGEPIIIQTWQYIVMGFALFLPIVLLTVALIIAISVITDSSSNTLGITIMLLVMAFIFENFVSDQSIIKLIYPYSYLFMDKIIQASSRANYPFGLLLNSLLAVGLLVLSYLKFVSKDFLGAKE